MCVSGASDMNVSLFECEPSIRAADSILSPHRASDFIVRETTSPMRGYELGDATRVCDRRGGQGAKNLG